PAWAKAAVALPKTTPFALVASLCGAAVTRNSFRTKLPLGARPGPPAGKPRSARISRRMAVMPVSLVLAVIVYFSGDGFLPVARIELSGSLLRTAPPADFMVPGSSTAQVACLAVFSHSTSRSEEHTSELQ